jgi:hypothetical protein
VVAPRCLHSPLLCAFAKLRKTTNSFVMSVRPSFRPSAWSNSAATGQIFVNLIFKYFLKICRETSSLNRIGQEKRVAYFTWRPACFWAYLVEFFLQWGMFWTNVEKIKTYILCPVFFFFSKIVPFVRYSAEAGYCSAGQVSYVNTAHAHCMLDTTHSRNV